MVLKMPTRRPRLPVMLQQRSTDEYTPRPYTALDHRIISQVRAQGPDNAARLSMSLGDYWAGRQGTAAALRAVDNAWGGGFYKVPKESELDRAAADDALGGNQLVIDVQGHYISARPATAGWNEALLGLAESVASDRFQGLGKLVAKQAEAGFSLVEFLRCIFLESETAVVVLTSAPGDELRDPKRMLNNSEMIGTRELIDRFAGSSRLINHCVVHPNIDGDLDLMDKWSEWCNPAGWKVYTLYADDGKGPMHWGERPYRLDDEKSGVPFLERVVDTGALMVCAHKGISAGADVGYDGPSSPRDIGPAAAGFPTVNFIVYHSGYEPREGDQEEGPYSEEVSNTGTNRLVKSLKNAGIKPGSNVYAELGTTWYLLMGHPREAAHVLGKLLVAVGEDNVVWGTDCIWYGPAQPLIDAFRAFQIPEEYSERYGYPQLTPAIKEKILGLNAARLYGIDPEQARATQRNDSLAWVKAAMEEYSAKGMPSVV